MRVGYVVLFCFTSVRSSSSSSILYKSCIQMWNLLSILLAFSYFEHYGPSHCWSALGRNIECIVSCRVPWIRLDFGCPSRRMIIIPFVGSRNAYTAILSQIIPTSDDLLRTAQYLNRGGYIAGRSRPLYDNETRLDPLAALVFCSIFPIGYNPPIATSSIAIHHLPGFSPFHHLRQASRPYQQHPRPSPDPGKFETTRLPGLMFIR
ncbi:hypothetical protein BO94DRAFT_166239 [Aspergillus sclerotioniger CBS 115572]|uniref:Uncharacterized protein n=1 Tax=Aspergillus sclerotioniger CBS 115572 TaxID=1450535 RepID=A0A317W285_9EURO|nr:hypothetical protein BO94DRAFT_166239 [Aspergillus sclerotioniger CBS 115572]PWY79382.1 hypothetical protein BO94DRAFT_166239 [Aspergillus sclerotioniger CBS 115572]